MYSTLYQNIIIYTEQKSEYYVIKKKKNGNFTLEKVLRIIII